MAQQLVGEVEIVLLSTALASATTWRADPTVINQSQQNEYIDIKYHFVREKITHNTIELSPTNDMLADALTEGLTHDKFSKLRNKFGVKQRSV